MIIAEKRPQNESLIPPHDTAAVATAPGDPWPFCRIKTINDWTTLRKQLRSGGNERDF